MKDKEEFYRLLGEIDGWDIAEYGRIIGDFDFGRYVLRFNRVAVEADAGPTLFLVRVPQSTAGFPPRLFNTPVRRTALEDLLTRKLAAHIEASARFDAVGVARRRFSVSVPGQKILPRTSLVIADEYVEARVYIQLPVLNGLIDGAAARDVFFEELPQLVASAMLFCNLDYSEVEQFVNAMEDADAIRQALSSRGLIGFVAAGSLLARIPDSDQPDYQHATPLSVAAPLQVEVETPNAGQVKGLGIPSGITVILGDCYSGRVELVKAIAGGIYNHIPGDGREMAIAMPDAVYVSADPGRSVQRVDISAFAPARVNGQSSSSFTATSADGFASQAASLVEALEIGARALLLDESESAPALLSSDPVTGGDSQVVSLVDRARNLVDEFGISIVVGVSTLARSWISIADTVLEVRDFAVANVTEAAKKKAGSVPARVVPAFDFAARLEASRWVVPGSIDSSVGRRDEVVCATTKHALVFGRASVNLARIEQLADRSQTATIGLVLHYGRQRYLTEARPIREILDLIDRDLSTDGLECLSRDLRGDLARPRRYEIAAALNRLATLRIARQET